MTTNHDNVNRSPLHQAALDYAAKGWRVFPCRAGEKKPATEHGFHDATIDPAQIDAWWSANPELNPAFCPHEVGLSIADLDGEDGLANWELLKLEHGAPDTFEVTTPRGGKHLYYKGELPPSVNKLAHHVDTRGRGSYALLPPSVIDGRSGLPESYWGSYAVTARRPCAVQPEWIIPALGKAREKAKASTADLDLPENLRRATEYVKRASPGRQGEGCDAQCYVLACDVLNLGVSPERAVEIILEHWGARCDPCDDRMPAFIERKVANATSYAQNEAGAWAVEPAAQTFKGSEVLGKLLAESAAQPARGSRFTPRTMGELFARPPVSWLVPDMLQANGVAMIYGPGGSYKTYVTLTIALNLALEGTRVQYVCGEALADVTARVKAWMVVHEIYDPDAFPFRITEDMPFAVQPETVQECIDAARDFGPQLVIIDTQARMAAMLNENDARDMGQMVVALNEIRKQLDTSVLVIHHTGKDVTRGARGSDALLFATDGAFEVCGDDQLQVAAMYCRRMKAAKRREAPWCYEGKSAADNLVFQEVSEAEYRKATFVQDSYAATRVGAILLDMGARGEEKGQTTHVVASTIVSLNKTSPEDHEDAVARATKVLLKRSRGNLQAYCSGQGQGLRWFLPTDLG